MEPKTRDGGDNVTARVLIRQSPLSADPDVPRGTRGHIEDYADGLVWVDFGAPYGTVACEPSEI